uniref:Uncharacterized protein n=1 Tax=Timema poppense TaxID=170557 RepID=A0A7R9DUW0_TIMPO|nr:unnamed protein product [Timema poppensis]
MVHFMEMHLNSSGEIYQATKHIVYQFEIETCYTYGDKSLFYVNFQYVNKLLLTKIIISKVFSLSISLPTGCFFSSAFESVALAMACLVPFDYVLMITSGMFINIRRVGKVQPCLVSVADKYRESTNKKYSKRTRKP